MTDITESGSTQKLDGVQFSNMSFRPKTTFKKAIILDRDGTLNPMNTRSDGTKGAPWELKDFHITSEAIKACELLKFHGYALLVATNQPDLGAGLTFQVLRDMNVMMKNYLKVDDILMAHERGSVYYKPCNGMLEDFISKYELDRNQTWMVGDHEKDIIAGFRSSLKTIFIGSRYEQRA